ncbi:transmembrane protein, putative [Medicago truncatula]|uniref:Transmembrane protein, putative n=1 Tax=Medicago truncatula TaxID=3880 RepID=G7LFI9_MEDTR|nr:transmembrane protein, putative [Medicago truncatula]
MGGGTKNWLDIDFIPSGGIGEHFHQFSKLVGMSCSSHAFFRLIWLACVWVIWKERNNCILKNVASDPFTLSDKVKLNSFLWLKTNQPSFVFSYHDWCRHPLLCMGVHI